MRFPFESDLNCFFRLHKDNTEMIIINAQSFDEARDEIQEHLESFRFLINKFIYNLFLRSQNHAIDENLTVSIKSHIDHEQTFGFIPSVDKNRILRDKDLKAQYRSYNHVFRAYAQYKTIYYLDPAMWLADPTM